METLRIQLLSSLEKIFPDEGGRRSEHTTGSMLRNEWHSFCTAVRYDAPNGGRIPVRIYVESPLAAWIEVRRIGLVPSELPCTDRRDDGYLRTQPGLFPDVLHPVEGGISRIIPGRWEGFWFRIRGDGTLPPGSHPVTVRVSVPDEDAERGDGPPVVVASAAATYRVEVVDARLPEQEIGFTQWLHADCIALAHGVGVFSEAHWALIGQYLSTAVRHGMTMVLTPVFTPPLDTAPGGERPTVQLVRVTWADGAYGFDFSRLDRWIAMGRSCGIRCFEISHLFTQWGLAHAPKILVEVEGVAVRRFGWETDSLGPEYRTFLQAFLPALKAFLGSRDLLGSVRFHISDEPSREHLPRYREAFALVSSLLGGLPVMDALSDPAYGRIGDDHVPVVAIDHIGPFLASGTHPLWGYYCCGQTVGVSNRFFAMPSVRNRILGIQLYYHDIQGFLHWGYDFYNSRLSLRPIDPYAVTDADGAFPSGDAFSVYPGKDGCLESLRLVVFHDALQDHRALKKLESLSGRAEVLARIRDWFGEDFSIAHCPLDPELLLGFRVSIDRAIAAHEARA